MWGEDVWIEEKDSEYWIGKIRGGGNVVGNKGSYGRR